MAAHSRRSRRCRHPAHLRHARRSLSHRCVSLQPSRTRTAHQPNAAFDRVGPWGRAAALHVAGCALCHVPLRHLGRASHRIIDASTRSRMVAHGRHAARRQHLRHRFGAIAADARCRSCSCLRRKPSSALRRKRAVLRATCNRRRLSLPRAALSSCAAPTRASHISATSKPCSRMRTAPRAPSDAIRYAVTTLPARARRGW